MFDALAESIPDRLLETLQATSLLAAQKENGILRRALAARWG